MPHSLTRGIEILSEIDLSDVRVHADSPKPARLDALAYAQAGDIHLGPGQERHLPHEAWHLVQQRQGRVRPTMQARGMSINGDPGLEREAEAMGTRATRLGASAASSDPAARPGEGSSARQQAEERSSPGKAAGGGRGMGSTGSGPAVVQRLVGFEIESGIPITKKQTRKKGDLYKDPTHKLEIATGVDGDIKVDHVPGHTQTETEPFKDWPIIEFVTDPLPETEPVDEFGTRAESWLKLLKTLRGEVDATPPTKPLKDKVSTSPDDVYIGFPGADKTMKEGGVDRISVQMTIGARLDRLEEVRKTISRANISGAMVTPGFTFHAKAFAPLAELMPAIEKKVGSPYETNIFSGKKKKTEASENLASDEVELQSFLHLICNYLIVAVQTKAGYIKNRTFLFYKSELSDVANELVTTNQYADRVLRGKKSDWVKEQILTATGRPPDEGVFPDSTGDTSNNVVMPTCQEWLDEVFAGTADRVFNFARNPWSKKLGPNKVDGKLAAVLELRSPSSLDPGATKAFNLSAEPAEVVKHLKALYVLNQNWQDIDPEV
jgi:hypothetical protein